MAKRPLQNKRLRRALKLFRGAPPTSIDLVQWLMDRRYAQTKGGARQLLVDGRVMSESHIVGRQKVIFEGQTIWAPAPLVPSHMRDTLRVKP